MALQIRAYRPVDRDACIACFRSNIPRYFRDHELPEFLEFIDAADCPYFVVLADGMIVGCGGYGLDAGGKQAALCWGMVSAEQHGKQVGRFLLLARLFAVATSTKARYVRLQTSQLTEGFFQRFGFEVQHSKPDGIANGLDEVEMCVELTGDIRAAIEQEWHAISNGETLCSGDQAADC